MLKVECESCKAPYQIDERRVPAAGLKMRCPKCGHSFIVKNGAIAAPAAPEPPKSVAPAASRGAPRPPAIAPRQAPPAPPPMSRQPSIPAVFETSDLDHAPPSASPPVPGAPAMRAPVIQKRTMMGVAGPAATASPAGPRVARPAPPPPVPGARPGVPARPPPSFDLAAGPGLSGPDPLADLSDLPASVSADLPAPARRAANKATAFGVAPPPVPMGGPNRGFGAGFGEMDLPATVDADLPMAASKHSDLPASPYNSPYSDLPAAPHSNLPASPHSDLPAAAEVDLPAAARVDLPAAARVGFPAAPARPAVVKRQASVGFGEIDLPSPANDLPAVASSLPSIAGTLPSVAQSLPSVAQSLPSVSQSLPVVSQSLPVVSQVLPSPKSPSGPTPATAFGSADDFGELELPRAPAHDATARAAFATDPPPMELPNFTSSPPPGRAAPPPASLFDENPFSSVAPPSRASGGGFGELELPAAPGEDAGSYERRVPSSDRGSVGGMAFGELDLGANPDASNIHGADNPFGEASLGSVIQPLPSDDRSRVSGRPSDDSHAYAGEGFGAPTEAHIDAGTAKPPRERGAQVKRGPSPFPKILAGLLVVTLLGGTAATFTPAGFFGHLLVSDTMHAGEYAKAATDAIPAMHAGLASDNFADAEAMADKLAAARAAKPRARVLTAVAAVAELETQLRFGKDADRANRAKLWLTDIPPPNSPATVKYLDVALAAGLANDREKDKARAAFDAVARKYAGDPMAEDIAFMRGELELRAADGAAATTAFKKVLELAPGARAHFGLAQAALLSNDLKTAGQELDATIAAAPKHGAALLVRAEMMWRQGRDDQAAEAALKDLGTLLEGPAKSSISTGDQSQAYAERGLIQFARGRSAEARAAFDDALKVDQRNVSALIGQGDVLYDEGRFTEAISRYDTAGQVDPSSVPAVVGSAKTQIALERLADAKTQLADAAKRFPKSALALQWLATAESALGDKKGAERDFAAAMDLVDPKDADAIEPYAAYASFLATLGRAGEAQSKLQDAVKKLPDSVGLERTLGDVAAVQGHFDEALTRYRAALAMDPKDTSSRFRLGQVLRKTNKIDEASKVFDEVYAADKNYPTLSLERGLLFEQAGDVEKALEQFKSALEKAPGDPDLKLRVGAAYVAIGQGEKAEPLLKDVGKDRPNSAEADHYLGRALMQEGPIHYQEAMRHLQVASGREPNRAEYHLYVGWLANLEAPPDLGLAHKEIQKALELDQTLADGFWQMGVNEFLTGQNDNAVRDLQHALQLKPTRFEAHATLAQAYEQKNMPDAAVAEWRLALAHESDKAIDPNEVALWNYKFGTLLNDRGQYGESAKRLKSSVEVAESSQPRLAWLTKAELATAEALKKTGDTAGACTHYAAFVQMSDQNDPDRRDARRACRDACGHVCEISQ